MLTAILAVTLSVPDLPAMEQAYAEWLGYRTVERGLVSREIAQGWGAPLAEGRRFVLMQPASGEPAYLRLVQSPATPGYAVMKTHGWNANEILVEDPDALAAKFASAGSPFRVVGPPRPLGTNPKIRAMQAIGPAGELSYFTRLPPEGGSVFVKASARSFVDRTFIIVLGGPSMADMRRFYEDTLGIPVSDPVPARINVIQDAWGLPREYETPLAIVKFSTAFVIELDEYPAAARPRPRREGDLPPGIALVTFTVKSLEAKSLPLVAPPAALREQPYAGRRSAVLVGAAGEMIELVEAP
jgi:catechol 2,3-dioxygenase-like lactoylglutathione lyase family enzyme